MKIDHVSRLIRLLRKATSKEAQAIWKEAKSLGLEDQLEKAYRAHKRG